MTFLANRKVLNAVCLLLYALCAIVLQAQSGCTPKTLPYFENFGSTSYVQMYDTIATNQCWTLFRSDPYACSYQYDVLWNDNAGGGQDKFIALECGYLFCDEDQNGSTDHYTRFQHTAVTPPLAEAPVRIHFIASNYSYGEENPVHLIVGYITDMGSIANSFVAFDTLTIPADGYNVFHLYSLIVPDTIATPCHIAFRVDTSLQWTEHPGDDTNNTYYWLGIGPARVFNDAVFLDNFEFIPRKHFYYDYYDTVCEGEGYAGYGFEVAPGHASELHMHDSSDACTTWHYQLHLCELETTVEELYKTIEPGEVFYFNDTPLDKAGDYRFKYVNRYGCDSTIIVHIDVHIPLDSTFIDGVYWPIWFPNAFTPGEETNNQFRGICALPMKRFELTVYTRAGLLVFHSEDPEATWDGTYKGKLLPLGTYVYHCFVSLQNGFEIERTGTVILVR